MKGLNPNTKKMILKIELEPCPLVQKYEPPHKKKKKK